MLELKNVSFSYGDSQVLNELNLTIADHSIHALVGLSGAGKTLILKLISGLTALQTGSIEKTHRNQSLIFQNADLFPWLTVEKNLEISCNLKSEEIHSKLKSFRMEQTAHLYPHQLSGGMSKKISLLRAFLHNSDLILMDEPFAHLDLAQKEEIYTFTLELWKTYKPTLILVSHDLDEAIYMSSQISYLSKKDKNIKKQFTIKREEALSFNESKTNPGHINYFRDIYNELKGDLQ